MKPEILLRLYPRPWRERYGDEFVALLEKEGTGPRVVLNVMAGAFDAWMSPNAPGAAALDGPLRRSVVFEPVYSTNHWLYLLIAMGFLALAVAGMPYFWLGVWPVAQFWFLRFFSLRTRVTAVIGTFVAIAGVTFALSALSRFLQEMCCK
ncbi:MAG: hypothetical protein WD690_12090 [Vicinamibacterales bacterium]